MHQQKQRLLSLLLTAMMIFSLILAGLFTIEAEAAEITYDSKVENFTFELGTGCEEKHPMPTDYLIVSDYTGSSTAVQIPEEASFTYQDAANTTVVLPVKQVSDLLPYESKITHIRLGVNTEVIARDTFDYSDALQEVEIPVGSKLKEIGYSAFCNCTNLRRIGVNGGNTLPETLERIGGYAFRETALTKLDLSGCKKLVSIGTVAFGKCAQLTEVKLPQEGMLASIDMSAFSDSAITSIELPNSLVYLGMNAFNSCRSLSEIIINGDIALFNDDSWEGSYALYRLAHGAVVRVNFDACSVDYELVMETIYSRMHARSDVRVTAIGSDKSQPAPTVRTGMAKSVITLENATGENTGFVYDWNDSDGDGFGGIVYVNGKESDMKLTINAGKATNADQVYWNRNAVYVDGLGYSGGFLRQMALAENALDGEVRGYVTASAPSVTLTGVTEEGAYIYYPKFVNKGTKSVPDGSVCGAPVLVIYRPMKVDTTQFNVKIGAGLITLESNKTNRSCRLTGSEAATLHNRNFITPWVEDPKLPLVTNVTKANTTYQGKPHKMTYQWYVSPNRNAADGVAVEGASGILTLSGKNDDGPIWAIGGLSEEYLNSLDLGIYHFFVKVTVEMAGETKTVVSDASRVIVYDDLKVSGITVDASGIGNSDYFDASAGGTSQSRPYVMRTGTRNLFFYPELPSYNLNGLEDLSLNYEWTYRNITKNSKSEKTFSNAPVVESSELPIDGRNYGEGIGNVYRITCNVRLMSGDTQLDFASRSFYITSTNTGGWASYDNWMTFAEQQSKPYLGVGYNEQQDMLFYTVEDVMELYGGSMKVTLYEGANGEQAGGGTPVPGGSVELSHADWWYDEQLGCYVINPYATNVRFGSYTPRWCYWKAELDEDDAAELDSYAPVYSEPFLLYPARWMVGENWDSIYPTNVSAKITRQPVAELRIPYNTYGDIEIDLNMVNLPAIYATPDGSSVLQWQYFTGEDSDDQSDPDNWCDIAYNWTDGSMLECYKQDVRINTSRLVGSTATVNATAVLSLAPMSDMKPGTTVPYNTVFKCATRVDNNFLIRLVIKDPCFKSGVNICSDVIPVRASVDRSYFDNPHSPVGWTNPVFGGQDGTYGNLRWLNFYSDEADKYMYGWVPDDAVQYDNTKYQIFCDAIDGLKEEYGASNIPDSPPAKIRWRTNDQLGASPSCATIMFYVRSKLTDEVFVLNSKDLPTTSANGKTTDPITIGSAKVYLEAGLDHGRRSSGDDYTNVMLVVEPGEGARYDVLHVTPVQVVDWSYKPGQPNTQTTTLEPVTVTVNPRERVSTPSVSISTSSASVKNAQQKVGLPLTVRGSIYVLDHEEVTYQWYRSLDNTYDIGSDMPVGEPAVSFGSVQPEMSIDAAEIEALESMGASQAYYYLWASNYDADARSVKYATARSYGAFAVYLRPDLNAIEPSDYMLGGSGTTIITYGEEIPEALGAITVDKPALGVRQTVYLNVDAIDTSGLVSDGYDYYRAVTVDYDGTVNNRNDDWFTVTESATKLNIQFNIAEYYDRFLIKRPAGIHTYSWSIDENVSYDSAIRSQYVTTARQVYTTTESYKLITERPDEPVLSNLTFDENTYTKLNINSTALNDVLGIDIIDGIKQYPQNPRPVYIDLEVAEGTRARLYLEYLDMETMTWKDASYVSMYHNGESFGATADLAVNTAESGSTYALPHEYYYAASKDENGNWVYDYRDNPGHDVVYYRFAARSTERFYADGTGNYNEAAGCSFTVHSAPFAIWRMDDDQQVDAQTPQYKEYIGNSVYWAKNDPSITQMTLGIKDNWYVEDGGTLTYEWKYWNSENNWVPLGTDETLTLTRAQVEELYATRDAEDEEIRFYFTVTNTNLANTTGDYEASASTSVHLEFRDMAVTPQATLSGSGAELTVGSELSGSAVAAMVSNPSSMGELTYKWYGRILGYTPVGSDTAYTIPEEQLRGFREFYDLYNSDPNRNVFTNANKVAVSLTDDFYMYDPENGSRLVSLTGQDNYYSVWQYADSVTMELYCTVENTDTAQEEGWQTSSADTEPVTVTFKVPDYLRPDALKITAENDDFCINDDESIVLLAPAVSGRTFSYEWRSKETEDTDYYYTFTDGKDAALTLRDVSSDGEYTAGRPWVGCKVTDTDLNIARFTDFKQVTRSVTGEAVKPTVIIQPNTITVMPGAGTGQYFKANAWAPDGGTLSYLWSRYRPETDEYVFIPGANTDTLYVDAYDDVPGEYIFMCTVSSNKDGQYASNDMTCYLDVIGVDFALPDDLPTAAAGLPYSFSFEVNNYGGEYYMKDIVWTLPDGWTIAKENGEEDLTDSYPGQSWILSTNSAAAVTNGAVTITGKQDGETVTFTDTFTLQVEDIIINGDGVLTPVPMNQTTALPALTAKGSSGGYTWKLNSAPDWLTINPSTGVLTADKPAVPGRYDISVTVTSGAGKSATRTFSLPVAGPHAEKRLDIIDSTGKEFYIDDTEDVSSGSGWSYDFLTGVLYLDGFNGRQIWSNFDDELWIVLSGDSKLENTTSSEEHILLFKEGALHITTAEGVSAAKLDLSSSDLEDSTFYGIYALEDLTIDEGVTLNVNLDNDSGCDCSGWYSYGDRTLKGDGAMNIRVSGGGSSTLIGIGVYDLSVYDDMDLTVTVDAQNTAATALGFRDTLYTYGTGDVTITCKDSTYMMVPLGWNGWGHDIAHTGGTLTLQASYTGKQPDTCCAISGGASAIAQLDESKYEIIGDPNGTFVSYRALTSGEAPKLTPDTLEAMEVAANVAMEDLTVKAASSDSVTWTVTGLPAGLTFTPAADTYSGVLSGTPTENGVYTVKITASNSAGSTDLIFSLTVSSTVVWLESDVEIKANGTLFYAPDIEYTGVPMDSWFIEVPAGAPFTLVNNDYCVYAAEIKEGAVLTPSDTPWICTLKALDADDNVIATSEVPVYIRSNAPKSLYLTDYIYMYGGEPMREDYESEDGCVKYDHLTGTLTLNNLSVESNGYGALDFGDGHLNVVYSGTNTISAAYDAVEIDGTVCFRAKNDNASLNFKSENGRALYGYNTDAVDGAITFQGGKVLLESQNDDATWLNPSDSYTPIQLVDVVNFTARTNATAEEKAVNLYNRVILDYSTEEYYVVGDAEGSKEYIVTMQSPAPTASVASGTWFGCPEIEVVITGADEDAEIYYLADIAPILSNMMVAKKVENGGTLTLGADYAAGTTVTLQLVALKDGVYSAVNTYTYHKIGTTNELEAVTADPDSCLFEDGETLSVTLSHDAIGVKISYSIDGGTTYTEYTGTPIQISDTTVLKTRVTTTYTTKNPITSKDYTYTKSSGVTVSGQVKSYNPANETTVQLKQGDTVAYETTIAAESGSGQVTQTFSIENVASGTYDLVVTKDGHLAYTVTGVEVKAANLDLTVNSNAFISTITMLAGDVNGDGSITESDVSVVRYASNINKTVDAAANPLADVNGDGSITESDVSVIRYAVHINKSTANCTYTYAE